MPSELLLCTDLDRTLIPNGSQPESPGARRHFAILAAHDQVTVAYVTGRHRQLVESAVSEFDLPRPDFVIGDVGTTLYSTSASGDWSRQEWWEDEIAVDWAGYEHRDLREMLTDLSALRLQEQSRQNRNKLSYFVPLQLDRNTLARQIRRRLEQRGVAARLIWSVDDAAELGLLDVVPARASKYSAIEALMRDQNFDTGNTIFSGDSGNDLEVLASPIHAVLVANSRPDVRRLARRMAEEGGNGAALYLACGGFMGMNGNYSAGILEGIAHYHSDWVACMGVEGSEQARQHS